MDYINKILCGDCLKVMKGFSDNSIDTIITDPPYGLEFMGKDWDKFKKGNIITNPQGAYEKKKGFKQMVRMPSDKETLDTYQEWTKNWATEALRVTKPGATLLCFGGTRTYHRLACAIEDAGWILKDCIMWLYGSGFPKATDISKQIDKNILRVDLFKPFAKHFKAQRLKKNLSHKDIAEHFPSRTGGLTGCVWNWENAENVPTLKQWNILKPLLDLSDEFLPLIKRIEAEREDLGPHPTINGKGDHFAFCANYNGARLTAPATPKAALWDGWKSHGLKPAYEPILVAMKSNEGSYANNALKWGVAGLNIDGGRIEGNKGNGVWGTNQLNCQNTYNKSPNNKSYKTEQNPKGRYPANVILDEEAGKMLDKQAPETGAFAKVKSGHSGKSKGIYYDYAQRGDDGETFYDDGLQGASRFFYCAKSSKSERNRGCEDIDIPEYRWNNSGICQQIKGRKGNFHPTVKPLSLMKYLCTLTKTPTGGIVLDPFCGSGTTLMACKELKRDYIGIDNNPEYCEIARNRIKAIPETLF